MTRDQEFIQGPEQAPVSALLGADWIVHDGGDCPVEPSAPVQPWFRIDDRDSAEDNGICWAKGLRWDHVKGMGGLSGWGDIIAYRVSDGALGRQDGQPSSPGLNPETP